MKNGQVVREFEVAFADYVGAKYAIALCNGTATLHTALLALGVKPGDRVAVPPLTMSATTLAVLHAGAVPVFVDVDPQTWLMQDDRPAVAVSVGVSLYGLHGRGWTVDDAAQTLRPHDPNAAFTSYSFQASKILALGEGGMLVTNDEGLAEAAREYSSLGYRMSADQSRIDPASLKLPGVARHYRIGWNYRMNDLTAASGLDHLTPLGDDGWERWGLEPGTVVADLMREHRRLAASYYADAIAGCEWLTPQHVPEGWGHSWWAYAVAVDDTDRRDALLAALAEHGAEAPWPAWRLAYQEPALKYIAGTGSRRDMPPCADEESEAEQLAGMRASAPHPCPVAEDLQPRLLQFATNNLASAEKNAAALRRAIADLS